jgi:hypothetical protein
MKKKVKYMENIETFDTKNNYHGYIQICKSDMIIFRCNYKHGEKIGYEEWHGGSTLETEYYIR